MNHKRLLVLLAGAALLGAVFLLLNFRIAMSINRNEKLVFTMDMGENMPVSMKNRDKISMVLVGEGPLVSALQKSLTEKMDEAGLGEIDLAQGLEPAYPNPVLVVKVGEPGPLWTPLFAMSEFSVHAGYASDGDTTFMEAVEQTHTSVARPDAANMYAEYDLSDRSFGLISRPGYHDYLAEYLAQEIVAALKDTYDI